MNWDAIGAIGEIVGAIAVVATLIYFAIQMRQYTTGLRSATFNATMQEFNQINIAQLDPALTDLLDRGMEDLDSLSPTEKYQFGWIVRTYINIWENMYQQYLEGACSESYWLPYARQAKVILATPAGRSYRKTNSLNQSLFTYLDSLPESERDFDFRLEQLVES
jgi:hypothetical protein